MDSWAWRRPNDSGNVIGTDLAGNEIIAAPTSGASIVTVDNTAPQFTAASQLVSAGSFAGYVENGDQIILRFNESMNAAAMGTEYNVVIQADDTILLYMGSTSTASGDLIATINNCGDFTSTAYTFNSSTGSWADNDQQLTITMANRNPDVNNSGMSSGYHNFTIEPAAIDLAGNSGNSVTTNSSVNTRW